MRIVLPVNEDQRTKKRFLLFPKQIDGEIRWLEKATWQERYNDYYETAFYLLNHFLCWETIKWIDSKENE